MLKIYNPYYFLFAFLFILGVILLGYSYSYEISLPIDVLLIVHFAQYFRRYSVLLFLFIYVFIFIIYILHSFNINLFELFYYLRFSASFPDVRAITFLSVFIISLSAYCFFLSEGRTNKGFKLNYGFAVAFVFVFLFRYVFYVENSLISKRNLGFPIATLGKAYYSMGFGFKDSIGDAYGGAEFNTRTAVIDLVRNINSKGANIYVFMVESWSDSESSLHRLEKIVTNKFAGRALSVSSGSIPSVGGTIQGEYRELCGRYFSSSDINDFPYSECLPDFLIKHGYRTTSAHGYKSMFYLRKYLYKKIGFQRSIFFEDVHKKLKICKAAFVGICDEELLNYMLTNVRATGEFVYFLSLQSHEPVTSDLINETEAEDAPKAVLVARRFILTTLDALKLSRSNDCYSFVYFIGDHPPPSVLSTDSGITKVSFLRFELSGVGDCHTPKGIEGSAI